MTFLRAIRFFMTKETIYIFLVVSLIAILILKDINNNFKEISLEKLEGISDHQLYLKICNNCNNYCATYDDTRTNYFHLSQISSII